MLRRLSVLAAVLTASVIGSLLARGCYPRPHAPVPRTAVSSASGEETFPEPDLASLRSRAEDLLVQIKAIRSRLDTDHESPATQLAAFENAAQLAAGLEQQAREIVSRLGTGVTVDPAEAAYIKQMALSLRSVNRNEIPKIRSALAASNSGEAVGSLDAVAAAISGEVAVPRTAVAPDNAAEIAAKIEALQKVAADLSRQTLSATKGGADQSELKPLVAEAGRRLEELEEALRQSGEGTAGAAAAAKALADTSKYSARNALGKTARGVRSKKYPAARSAARRFARAVQMIAAGIAPSVATPGGAAPVPVAATSPNPAAQSSAFDQKAPIVKPARRRRAPRIAKTTPPVAGAPGAAAEAAKPVAEPDKPAVESPAAAAAETKAPSGAVRPQVTLHPELIPKDIHIVRVYYATMIAAPGDTIEFDINGSGFNEEFQKRLSVQAGMEHVEVKDFSLVTPNQIHGRLVIAPSAATAFAFPTVSIGEKVVFQAAAPYAVIRPGEVLNLVFTEMGESGRTGRFRVFTNLDEAMLAKFHVEPSVPSISLGRLSARLPFIVDGTISVGPAVTGVYGVRVMLANKVLWNRDGIIRIVNPNVGQTGLVLRVQAEDGFQRPGDVARFVVQGSGFQGSDADVLTAEVPDMPGASAKFTYLSAGRLSVDVQIPSKAKVGIYSLTIRNKQKVLLTTASAFKIVPTNWFRSISTTPPLKPGGKAQLVLQGRALQGNFAESLVVHVDDPGLKIGKFQRISPIQAVADISAESTVRPGDYQVRIEHLRFHVVPESGDIIRILPAE